MFNLTFCAGLRTCSVSISRQFPFRAATAAAAAFHMLSTSARCSEQQDWAFRASCNCLLTSRPLEPPGAHCTLPLATASTLPSGVPRPKLVAGWPLMSNEDRYPGGGETRCISSCCCCCSCSCNCCCCCCSSCCWWSCCSCSTTASYEGGGSWCKAGTADRPSVESPRNRPDVS